MPEALTQQDVRTAVGVAAQNWGLPASAVDELAASPQVWDLLEGFRRNLSTTYMGTDQTGDLYWAPPEQLGANLINHNNIIGLFNEATGGKYSNVFANADSQATQFKEANKVGGLLSGEIPWQAALMLGVMGAGAGGFLGAAGAPGGAAGGGIVGGGLEGVAASAAGSGLGLGAGEGLVGWDALGNAASGGAGQVGSIAGEAGWGVTQGAGEAMDVWDLLGDPSMYGLDSGGLDAWSYGPGNLGESAWDFGPGNIGDTGLSGWNNEMASQLGSTNLLDDIRRLFGGSNGYTSAAKSLLGGLGGGSSDATGGLLGGLLGGSGGSGGLDSLLGLAPILGGLAYGYNMAEPDLGRLESLYDQYNPQASLGLYDYNTEMGRNQLYSNLGRRGISGSSFANNDVTNYNTVRDMGRGSTLNQGVSTAANIANQIATLEAAGNRTKTDLIGRGLYSIGTLFGGK